MFFPPLLQGAAQQQAGAGQWQFVANAVATNQASATTTVSSAFAVSVGQLIIVAYGWEANDGGTVSLTDSAGNTYTGLTRYTSSGPQWMQLFYCVATAASASNAVTVTTSLSVSFRNLTVQVFQPPPGTASLDTSSGGSASSVINLTGVNVDPVTTGSSLITFSSKIYNTGTYDPGEIGWQETNETNYFISMFQNVSNGDPRPVGVKRTFGAATQYVYAWASFTISTGPAIYRPTSDITTTGWTASTGSVLYDMIDEVIPSDIDYILSPDVNAAPGPATFGIGSAPAGTYVISLRAMRTSSVGQIRALLKDSGGTTVGTSSWQTITGAFTTYNFSVTTTGTAAQLTIEVQP